MKPYRPASNQRLDPALYASAGAAVFITVRAYLGQSPFVTADLNRTVVSTLLDLQNSGKCIIFVYCLMPDHLHFIASPRGGNSMLTLVERFKGRTTHLSWSAGWRGKLWQPRFYDHIVRREESLLAIAEYVLANPVRKGLVEHPEAWPWCGCPSPISA